MEKLKIYVKPSMEILAWTAQNIMIVSGGGDVPIDPGTMPAPKRRTPVF